MRKIPLWVRRAASRTGISLRVARTGCSLGSSPSIDHWAAAQPRVRPRRQARCGPAARTRRAALPNGRSTPYWRPWRQAPGGEPRAVHPTRAHPCRGPRSRADGVRVGSRRPHPVRSQGERAATLHGWYGDMDQEASGASSLSGILRERDRDRMSLRQAIRSRSKGRPLGAWRGDAICQRFPKRQTRALGRRGAHRLIYS